MVGSRPVAPGRIFISYRRAESAYPTGWLYERLASHFGREDIIRDIDSIEPGDDFVDVIGRAVASCDVMLVVIGIRWTSIEDVDGRRRLDIPDDFVRREIEAALERDIRVIPILVDGATMPRNEQLPPSLVKLSRRQALELSPQRFQYDTDRLLRVLDKTVSEEMEKRPLKQNHGAAESSDPYLSDGLTSDPVWHADVKRDEATPGLFLDRYELKDLLGRGGMAEVRRALDTRLRRPVAVKQLRPDLAADPAFQARFRRGAQSAAGLNHPNIVAVYDTTLRDVLRDGRGLLPERALELTRGVLDALGYIHRAGIIHRNIDPANVMLTQTSVVKVVGLGIARAVADTSDDTMARTAGVVGTARYFSPEQARGETLDARSDLYSAGCLLYELLVGRPPFVGESSVGVAYQHVREMPVPPSHLDPVITPGTDAITLKALAKDPADRYQSAREMAADIDRVLAERTP
jgi:hypothetical protein